MNKKTLVPAVALTTLALIGLVGVQSVSAQENQRGYESIVERLSKKFNLDQTEVQAVFDEQHREREQYMQQRGEEKLNTAVENGTITEAQKNELVALREKLHNEMEDIRTMTQEEREVKIKEHSATIQDWAEKNNVDMADLDFGFGGGQKMGFGRRQGK